MVRIRLRRTGAKNNPTYRIVVADVRAPRDGDFIESIGHYLPTRQPHVVEINEERARHWISNGAQPSDTAASLLRQKGILNAQGKLVKEGDVPVANVYPSLQNAPRAVEAAPVVAEPVAVAAEPVVAEPVVAATEPVAEATPVATEVAPEPVEAAV